MTDPSPIYRELADRRLFDPLAQAGPTGTRRLPAVGETVGQQMALAAVAPRRSQNGYVVDRALIVSLPIPGTSISLPVRKGPAGQLLIAAAARWNRDVEPLTPGTCWGYADRAIRGATQTSNHASGTAIDLDAPKHPLGTAPERSFTLAQIAAVRRIVADSRGCLRWGGDYTGRQDPMHLEVVTDEARCAAVLPAFSAPDARPPTQPPAPAKDDTMPLTTEQDGMLRLLVAQLVIGTGPTVDSSRWGWPTFQGGSGEVLTVVDLLRRANERQEQILARLDALERRLGPVA